MKNCAHVITAATGLPPLQPQMVVEAARERRRFVHCKHDTGILNCAIDSPVLFAALTPQRKLQLCMAAWLHGKRLDALLYPGFRSDEKRPMSLIFPIWMLL